MTAEQREVAKGLLVGAAFWISAICAGCSVYGWWRG